MTTCLICEDEPLMQSQLREALEEAWPELDVIGVAGDGITASRLIDDLHPDIAFLDIRMPGLTGIEVARHVAGRCHVVFVSAYDEYAIQAFEHGAIDYILKPVESSRLVGTVTRLKSRVCAPPADIRDLLAKLSQQTERQPEQKLKWIQASLGNTIKFIPIDEVLYFQSDAKYTRVVTVDGESLIRKALKELLEELDEETFWQIHRGTIINMRRISAVQRDGDGGMEVLLKGCKDRLPVSQTYHHRFRQQ